MPRQYLLSPMVCGDAGAHACVRVGRCTRSDVMLAIYPGGGARFAKHIDNTANDGRRLTLLCYLNPNW